MAIVECKHGHLYNDAQHTSCPYCAGAAKQVPLDTSEDEQIRNGQQRPSNAFASEEVANQNSDRSWVKVLFISLGCVIVLALLAATILPKLLLGVANPATDQPAAIISSEDLATEASVEDASTVSSFAAINSAAKPVAIDAGYNFIAVLHEDGKVSLLFDGNADWKEQAKDLEHVVQIACSGNSLAALLDDGTVCYLSPYHSTDNNDTDDWTNITKISAYDDVFALTSDGSVRAWNQAREEEYASWNHIADISATDSGLIGLTEENTIQTFDEMAKILDWYALYKGASEITGQINRIYADDDQICGIMADGSLWLALPFYSRGYEMLEWSNLEKAVYSGATVLGLGSDGSVMLAGQDNDLNLDAIAQWDGIIDIAAFKFAGYAALAEDGSIFMQAIMMDEEMFSSCKNSVLEWNEQIKPEWAQ